MKKYSESLVGPIILTPYVDFYKVLLPCIIKTLIQNIWFPIFALYTKILKAILFGGWGTWNWMLTNKSFLYPNILRLFIRYINENHLSFTFLVMVLYSINHLNQDVNFVSRINCLISYFKLTYTQKVDFQHKSLIIPIV